MSNPETDVLAVLDRLTEAWNAGDAAAYADLFTEEADYVTFFGANMAGRELIESSHRALFHGPLKGSTLTGHRGGAKVRFVRPDVAIVVSGGGSSLAGGTTPEPGRSTTVTFVLVKDDRWRVTAFQNTRVSDPAARGAA